MAKNNLSLVFVCNNLVIVHFLFSLIVNNWSPSDLDADLEDNQDYDSTVSQSETNLTMIGQSQTTGVQHFQMDAPPEVSYLWSLIIHWPASSCSRDLYQVDVRVKSVWRWCLRTDSLDSKISERSTCLSHWRCIVCSLLCRMLGIEEAAHRMFDL